VPSTAQRNSNRPSSRSIGYPISQTNRGVFPLVKWACGPFVDEGEGGPRGDALLSDEPSVGPAPNGVKLKAERRKPSGEKSCDIEDIPSLTGVLAHFRLHEFNAIRACPGGGGLIRVSEVRALPGELIDFLRKIVTRQLTPVTMRVVDGRFTFLALFSLGFQRSTPFRGALCFERNVRGCDRNPRGSFRTPENRLRNL
jgi:hypothetical protein